jgi:hypothetical protein
MNRKENYYLHMDARERADRKFAGFQFSVFRSGPENLKLKTEH